MCKLWVLHLQLQLWPRKNNQALGGGGGGFGFGRQFQTSANLWKFTDNFTDVYIQLVVYINNNNNNNGFVAVFLQSSSTVHLQAKMII